MSHRTPLFFASLLCLFTTSACGKDAPASPSDPSGASGQAGQAGSSGSAGALVEPTPPTPSAPPVLTPCPERWTEKTLPSGVIACEPGPLPDWTCPPGWLPKPVLEGTPQQYNICEPPPLPETCPEGTMPVLGQTTCQPIGDPCPAGDFPEGLPTDKPILYVKAGATGGDGSKEKPLATVGEAVQKAGKGTVVAIGKGLYPEAITVGAGKDVTLWGACVNEVKLQGPPGSFPEATVVAEGVIGKGSKLSLKNLTITGERPGIVYFRIFGFIDGVIVKGSQDSAMILATSEVNLRSVVVKETNSKPKSKSSGWGLECNLGAQVKVERSLFDHNRDIGVFAALPGTSLSYVLVQNTQNQESSMEYGVGVSASSGASLFLHRSLLRSNKVAALLLQSGAQASLSSVWLADTAKGNFTPLDENGVFLQQPIQGVGDGLVVVGDSSVTVMDLLSSGMSRAGLLFVGGTGTLSSTTSTGNEYGLVLRGSSQPTYDATCSFEGNETPILPDGDLPVPNAPIPTIEPIKP